MSREIIFCTNVCVCHLGVVAYCPLLRLRPVNNCVWVCFPVVEGLALLDLGVSPYSGDVFHETPLIIYFFHFMVDYAEIVYIVSCLHYFWIKKPMIFKLIQVHG